MLLNKKSTLILIFASAVLIPFANAEPTDRKGERRGPPPEAIEACSDQQEGAACQFTGRRGDAEGTCISLAQNEAALACAPEGHPRGRPESSLHEN